MVMKKLLTLAFAAAALAGGAVAAQSAGSWQIGPIINGKNYSPGMPSTMEATRAGHAFDFPQSRREGHVHYVTAPVNGLSWASTVRMRYRIDAEPGTRFIPQQYPDKIARLSLYFQRQGDNWSAAGPYSGYRWYAVRSKTLPLSPGTHEVTLRFEPSDWISVLGGREGFASAVREAGRIGFVFGSDRGRGHGVYATAPARFTLLDFDIR